MSFNGSGTYSLPAGNPVVTGTTISSTTHNNTMSDVATALSTTICKDGQTTPTANIPMGGFRLTGLGDATALQDAITAKQVQNCTPSLLATVAGTNTITASATPTPAAYASGQKFILVPANTNTGATTINISSLGAKSIFCAGRACIGGELKQGQPVEIEYDGTQFNMLGPVDINTFTEDTSPDLAADYVQTYDASGSGFKKVLLGRVGSGVLGTEQATTSGASIDVTGIPSWAKKIIIQFSGVSTNGTDNWLVQLGDSGGIETTGYAGSGIVHDTTPATSGAVSTAGFLIASGSAANVIHGNLIITLEDAANNTWVCSGTLATSNAAAALLTGGSKSLSATLDRFRLTTTGGANTFDAGAINYLYE